ncbi:MAG TPA: hypothetical protein VD902_05645, partial [Symbiobacteriaceae bacterium]|nr:hypothetical protein [Symbiobacteriaceae bacterium]
RERTERYRWSGEAFQLADRQFMPSRYSYHKLIDGITAEQFGRHEEALQLYQEATDVQRKAAPAEWLELERAGAFPEAVRAFAGMRRAVLLLQLGRVEEAGRWLEGSEGQFSQVPASAGGHRDRETACRAVTAHVAGQEAFMAAINAVMGYASPRWSADNICGALPEGE